MATSSSTSVWLPVLPDMSGFGPGLVRGAGSAVDKQGKILGTRFGKVLVSGVALGAVGIAGVGVMLQQTGKVFEDVQDTIRVGTGATGQALDDLTQTAKNIGQVVPASFEDIGTTVADLNTGLGLTGEPLENVSSKLLELTRITGGDLSTNVNRAVRLFGDWDISADDSAEALDKLFRASQNTGIEVDTLAGLMTDFGAPLRQLGYDFDESAALMGKWEREGVNTGTALGGMRQALSRFARDGKNAAEEFPKVIDEIQNMGDAGEATARAIEIFGARAGPDMAAAIREGRFEIDDYLDAIVNGEDTIDAAAESTMRWEQQWQLFKNNVMVWLEPLAGRVFHGINEALGVGIEGARAFVDAWQGEGEGLEQGGVVGFMAAVGERGREIADWVQEGLIPALIDMRDWFDRNSTTLGVVAGVITAIMLPALVRLGVTALVSAGKSVAAWTMSQAGAIRAGAVYVLQSLRIIGTWAAMAAAAVVSGAQTVAIWAMYKWEAIKAAGVYVAQRARIIGSWVAMAAAAVASGIQTAAVWTGMVIRNAALGAASFVASAARVVGGWVLMSVQSLLHAGRMAAAWFIALGPVGWVTAAIIGLAALVIANWDKVVEWTKRAWSATVAFIVGAWQSIRTRTLEILTAVVSWVVGRFTGLRDRTREIWGSLKDAVVGAWRAAGDFIGDFWRDRIQPVLTAFGNFISVDVVGKVRSGIGEIKSAWNTVANIFREPINWVINTVWNNGIKKAFDSVASAVGSETRMGNIPTIGRFGGDSGSRGDIPGYAKGGYHKGGWAIVGEEGPELVDFESPGRVYTASQTRSMLDRGDGLTTPHEHAVMSGAVPHTEAPIGDSWWRRGARWVANNTPIGAAVDWVRGGLADAAEMFMKPILNQVTGFTSQFGLMGQLGSGMVDDGFEKVLDWIRGQDAGGEYGGTFTENPGGFNRPSSGVVTSRYGRRSIPGGFSNFHAGIDLAAGHGSPIRAAWSGVVKSAGWGPGNLGNLVVLNHGGYDTAYGHLSSIGVRPGQDVTGGQVIGREGSTGGNFASHLHFERHVPGFYNPQNVNHLFRDQGGLVPPGVSLVRNDTNRPEYMMHQRLFDGVADEILNGRGKRGSGGETHIHQHMLDSKDAYRNGQEMRRALRKVGKLQGV